MRKKLGSGGTGLDIALANKWSSTGKKIHGVRIWGEAKDFYKHAQETLDNLGINEDPAQLIDIIDGYVGKGYGDTWPELLKFCLEASKSGIFLDRVYTGKV